MEAIKTEIRKQTDWADTSPSELLEAHLARNPNTARCYAGDMQTFGDFLSTGETVGAAKAGGVVGVAKATNAIKAIKFICDLNRGAAERTVHNYLAYLRGRYEALNTIRRKVQSLMGLLKLAHKFGVVEWAIEPMKLPAPAPIRDTRGPGRAVVAEMIELCGERDDAKGARDAAMLRLMAFSALRCNETLTLDLKHVDIDAGMIEILAKGLWGRTTHPITLATAEAIGLWLEFRGVDDGPLFTTLARGVKDKRKRLTYWGAYDAVRRLAAKTGNKCSPHKLRHFAATEHLRLTNGDVPWAMALTRHKDPRTLMIYNDSRMTKAREAMELVEAGVPYFHLKGHT